MGDDNVLPSWRVPDVADAGPLKVQSSQGSIELLELPVPATALHLGAMSSAANGILGAPALRNASQPHSAFCSMFPCQPGNTQGETAICSDPYMSQAHEC